MDNIGFKFSISRREYYLLSIRMALKGIIIMICINALLFGLWGLLLLAIHFSPYFGTMAEFGDKMFGFAVIVAIVTGVYVAAVLVYGLLKVAYYSIRSPRFFGPRVISIGELRAAVMYSDQTKQSYDLAALRAHYADSRYLVYKDMGGVFIIKKDALSQEELKQFYIRLTAAYKLYLSKQKPVEKK